MEEYAIDSIEYDICKKTSDNILMSLINCDQCFKIPTPQYKSFRLQNTTYCKSCYLNNNNKLEDAIHTNQIEKNLLNQVILSCTNMDCNAEFKIKSYYEKIEHENKCGLKRVNFV